MSIKLIAVDMDGTFLRSDQTYDRARFNRLYQEMTEKSIKFVVASGNQYYQLISFFPDIEKEIAFIADNGAYVKDESDKEHVGKIAPKMVKKIISNVTQNPEIRFVACGEESAYIHKCFSQTYYDTLIKHYHRLKWIDSYDEIDDTIFKFCLNLTDDQSPDIDADAMHHFEQEVQGMVGDILTPLASGFDAIDLIIPGEDKAHGLRILQKKWGIDNSEVAAFGDGNNDIGMLEQSGESYAMLNASDRVKAAAKHICGSNNDDGVLDVIEDILSRA